MIIVDSHVIFWLGEDPRQLSERAKEALAEARREGQLAIAAVTLREIAWMLAKRRVTIPQPSVEYLRFVESKFRVISLNAEIAWRATEFGSRYPRDPADRIIGATSVMLGAQLVTKDDAIRGSGEVDCIW